MTTDILSKSLSELGLDELEINVYQFLLKTKSPTVSEIAKKLGTQRLKIYGTLQSLKTLGLVRKENDFKRNFEIEPPTKIVAMLKVRTAKTKSLTEDLEKKLPDLLEEFHRFSKISKVRFYETKESFIQVLDEFIYESGGQIWCIGSPKILELAPEYMDWYIQKRRQNKVVSNSIMFENESLRKRDNIYELRPLKWIPVKFSGDAAIIAYGNKTAIWNTTLPKIIVIEDEIICEFFKTIFDLLWQKLDE